MKLILLVLALILILGDVNCLKSKLFQSTKDQKFDGIPLRVINGNRILCAVRALTSNNFSAKIIFFFQSICLSLETCDKFAIQGYTKCELFGAEVSDKVAAPGWQTFEK